MIKIIFQNFVNDYGLLKVLSVVLAAMLLSVGNSTAASLTPTQIAEKLQRTYDNTKSFSAEFQQKTSMRLNQRKRHGEGSVVILKPGRIRWDYQKPDAQVLVSDGKTFSMYFAKASQMIVKPVDEYLQSDVTYSFFAGSGNIVKDFDIFPPEIQVEGGVYCIKLIPKETHPQVDYLHICANENFLISGLQIVDQFGTITDLYFSNIKINQQPAASLFNFTPPPDTEIIKQ